MAFRYPFPLFAGSILLSGATAFVVSRATIARAADDELRRELALYTRIRSLIRSDFVEDVEPRTLLHLALHGMVEGLDPYSRFYEPEESRGLEEETSGRFAGIGVVIETTSPPITIAFPQPGSPAEKAGIGVGDRIVEVDGVPTEDLDPEEARGRIRGAEGTTVKLAVLPGEEGERREVTVRREEMRDTTVSLPQILDPREGIGYLWISSFSEETVAEFDAVMEGLQQKGMRSLILDLRFNSGGVLEAAVTLARRFVRDGTIVETRGRTDDSWSLHEAKPAETRFAGMPLVVLLNEGSASASEVVAGALQDHRVAVLVGKPSYGKGVVQSIKRVGNDGTAIKLTTARYYTPAGRTFDREGGAGNGGGIEPDVWVELDRRAAQAIRDHLERYEVPEKYRAKVEERRKRLGIEVTQVADPQLDSALGLLRRESPKPRRLR